MRQGRFVIGLPVVALADGQELGEVNDVVFDPVSGRILGFEVVRARGFFRNPQVILMEEVYRLGEDALIITDAAVLKTAERFEDLTQGEQVSPEVIGLEVVTEGGKALGTIDDIIFDTDTGEIQAYELSDGILRDLMDGRVAIPRMNGTVAGKDAFIVPAGAERRLRRIKDGLGTQAISLLRQTNDSDENPAPTKVPHGKEDDR